MGQYLIKYKYDDKGREIKKIAYDKTGKKDYTEYFHYKKSGIKNQNKMLKIN